VSEKERVELMVNGLTLVLAASVLLQLVAAAIALQLAWQTGWWKAWSLVSLGICGMAARRIVSLISAVAGDADLAGGVTTEFVGLGISMAMLVGLAWVRPCLRRMWRNEHALRESEARSRAMVEAVDGLVYICSQDYHIEFMNAALIERTGRNATGAVCYEVLHDFNAPCPWCPNESIWNGESVRWEMQSPKDDKHYFVSNTPIYHADGSLSKQTVAFDITDRKQKDLEIRQLKERFHNVIEGVEHVDIHAINRDAKIVYWNRGAERMYGYSKDEAIGRDLVELLIDEPRHDEARTIIREAFETGLCPPPMEFSLYDRDGEVVEIYCDHALVQVDDEPAELFCVAADMRPLRAAEQQAAALEERLQRLIDNTQDVIVIHDPEGRYVYYHGPACYDVTSEEVIGKTPQDLFGPEQGKVVVEHIQDVLSAGEPKIKRYRVDWKGRSIWFDSNIFPLWNSEGELTGVGKICRNVTEAVEAEANLQRRDRVLEAVTSAAEAFLSPGRWQDHIDEVLARIGQAAEVSRVYVFQNHRDKDGHLQTSQRYEWVAEGITSKINCPDLQDIDCETSIFLRWLRSLQAGETLSAIVADLPAEEREFLETHSILSLAAMPVMIGEEFWGFIGFDDCRTERHWSPAELDALKLAAELLGGAIHHDRLTTHIMTANKLESIGVLAGGIAHDFNNILTAISGNVSLAKLEDIDPADMSDMLAEAEHACTRAKALVQQLMTFSKGSAPRPEPVDLAALIEETVASQAQQIGAAIATAIPEPLWPADLDRDQVSQVLRNLLINAQQAGSEQNLRVEACNIRLPRHDAVDISPGPYVRISVIDQGEGIASEYLEKIFDPYFTTRPDRSGLGLSAAYAIVHKHGGLISVQSEPGKGSRFDVYLPAHRNVSGVAGAQAASVPAQPSRTRRVLVMDDEAPVRQLVSRMLERMGFSVVVTCDGQAAVDAYAHAQDDGEPFDLVVMDLLVAGGMGGQQATAEILDAYPDARIMVASGYSETPVLARPDAYGFCGQISKPFDVDDFQQEIRRVLET
jgi:PAS domain S-box-containing protein